MSGTNPCAKVYSVAALGLYLLTSALWLPRSAAQSPEMQQRLTEVKNAVEVNKLLLAQYTWMEQDIISIKGEQKKEELYNVQMGPNGKPQKTPVDPNSMSDDERHRRGLRGRIIERKIDEYKEYESRSNPWFSSTYHRIRTCCNKRINRETFWQDPREERQVSTGW